VETTMWLFFQLKHHILQVLLNRYLPLNEMMPYGRDASAKAAKCSMRHGLHLLWTSFLTTGNLAYKEFLNQQPVPTNSLNYL